MINIFVDGGARGNPGPAAIGVYAIDENNHKLCSLGERIGSATNNFAEYSAVIKALLWLIENKENFKNEEFNIHLDSKLVYSQISGLFKIKNAELRNLLFKVRQLEADFGLDINYINIPREKNANADRLVNLALDNKI